MDSTDTFKGLCAEYLNSNLAHWLTREQIVNVAREVSRNRKLARRNEKKQTKE
jgi:hypothetical protein